MEIEICTNSSQFKNQEEIDALIAELKKIRKEKFGHHRRPIKYEINDAGCWICTNFKTTINGELVIHVKKPDGRYTFMRLVKYLYRQRYGVNPDDKFFVRTCANKQCINLDHIKIFKTKREMIEFKGQTPRPRYADKVAMVRHDYAQGVSQKQIAKNLGLAQHTVAKMVQHIRPYND